MSKCALSLCVCVCDPFPGIFFSLFSFGARSRQLPSKAGSDLPISYILLSSLVHYPWKNPRRFPISRNYAGLAHSIFSKENPREQAMNFHFPSLTFLGKPSGKQKTRRTPQPRSSPFIPIGGWNGVHNMHGGHHVQSISPDVAEFKNTWPPRRIY